MCTLCVVDARIKDQAFRFIGFFFASNDSSKRSAFLQGIDPFLMISRQVILVGDWNVIFDPDKYGTGTKVGTNNRDVKPFQDIIDRLDLVEKFRNDFPREVV